MMQSNEQFVGTVDVWQLSSGIWWMITRVCSPRFVEEVELGRYMRGLLATRQWSVVRVVPHINEQGLPSAHVFDVYGVPTETTFSPTVVAPTVPALGRAAQPG
jgi:hypothetical protein